MNELKATEMAGYLSGIVFTEDGYLLLPDNEAQGGRDDRKPLVLASVEQLWLKFNPHCQVIQFVPTSASTTEFSEDFATQPAGTSSPTPTQIPIATPTRSVQLSDLIRFKDMSNNILPILEDIDKMKDQQRFLSWVIDKIKPSRLGFQNARRPVDGRWNDRRHRLFELFDVGIFR